MLPLSQRTFLAGLAGWSGLTLSSHPLLGGSFFIFSNSTPLRSVTPSLYVASQQLLIRSYRNSFFFYLLTYGRTDDRTIGRGSVSHWTDVRARAGAFVFDVLYVYQMTPAQEKQYQEAIKRAASVRPATRSYAIRYGR